MSKSLNALGSHGDSYNIPWALKIPSLSIPVAGHQFLVVPRSMKYNLLPAYHRKIVGFLFSNLHISYSGTLVWTRMWSEENWQRGDTHAGLHDWNLLSLQSTNWRDMSLPEYISIGGRNIGWESSGLTRPGLFMVGKVTVGLQERLVVSSRLLKIRVPLS